jgi:hypothetical protein
MQPGGRASIVNYNVPEPTSYRGRNYIHLSFPGRYFKSSSLTPTKRKVWVDNIYDDNNLTRPNLNEKIFSRLPSQNVFRFIETPGAGLKLTSKLPLSSKLGNIDPNEIISMVNSGKQLKLYRSLEGKITYRYIDARKMKNAAILSFGKQERRYATFDPNQHSIVFDAPTEGQTFHGPSSGVSIHATGVAYFPHDPPSDTRIELRFGSSPPIITRHSKFEDTYYTWDADFTIKASGSYSVTVKIFEGNQVKTQDTVQIHVLLDKEQQDDTQTGLSNLPSGLVLVEFYQLSSYLGNYGAGRTIQTFSLLPGEKTKISIKTYKKTESSFKESMCTLDSLSEESADDLQNSIESEQSDKTNYNESFNYHMEADVDASWGWGSASVSGGVSGGTNSSREQFAKNVSNGMRKHSNKASAKRDVTANTSYEVKQEMGEETSIERIIENINLGRTLNFVFRQMNQEFITILHLVDVRLLFYNGNPEETKEVTLPQLNSLLEEVVVPLKVNEVRTAIINQLKNIFDYRGYSHSFLEQRSLNGSSNSTGASSYWRIKKDYASVYDDSSTGTQITVPGIILSADKIVLRTDGVIVDALLGQGEALDEYSRGLQTASVRSKELQNTLLETIIDKNKMANKIIENKDVESAKIFGQVYPCCEKDEKQVEDNGDNPQ